MCIWFAPSWAAASWWRRTHRHSAFEMKGLRQSAFLLGSATSGLLTAGMLPRFLRTGKVMPTGLVSFIGLMVVGLEFKGARPGDATQF